MGEKTTLKYATLWPPMTYGFCNWPESAPIGPNGSQLAPIVPNWPQSARIGPFWPVSARTRLGHLSNHFRKERDNREALCVGVFGAELQAGTVHVGVDSEYLIEVRQVQHRGDPAMHVGDLYLAARHPGPLVHVEQDAQTITGNVGEFLAVDDNLPDPGFDQIEYVLDELLAGVAVDPAVGRDDQDVLIEFMVVEFHVCIVQQHLFAGEVKTHVRPS